MHLSSRDKRLLKRGSSRFPTSQFGLDLWSQRLDETQAHRQRQHQQQHQQQRQGAGPRHQGRDQGRGWGRGRRGGPKGQAAAQQDQLHPGAAQRAGAAFRRDALPGRLHERGAESATGAVRSARAGRSTPPKHWLIDWLIYLLIYLLIYWLTYWLIDWINFLVALFFPSLDALSSILYSMAVALQKDRKQMPVRQNNNAIKRGILQSKFKPISIKNLLSGTPASESCPLLEILSDREINALSVNVVCKSIRIWRSVTFCLTQKYLHNANHPFCARVQKAYSSLY